jgi:hypothetical protein
MTRLSAVGQLMKLFYFSKRKKIFLTVKQQDFSGINHETTAISDYLNKLCSATKIVEFQIVVKENSNSITERRYGDFSDKLSVLGKINKNENLVHLCICDMVVFFIVIYFSFILKIFKPN